jgi:signal transduction histidine kinase
VTNIHHFLTVVAVVAVMVDLQQLAVSGVDLHIRNLPVGVGDLHAIDEITVLVFHFDLQDFSRNRLKGRLERLLLLVYLKITPLTPPEMEENKKLQAQKMESIGRLAGGVAHDFNNMLGVIFGRAELAIIKADAGRPLLADLLEIKKAAERSADITTRLLAFARKQTISPRALDLNLTAVRMLRILQKLIGEDIHLL